MLNFIPLHVYSGYSFFKSSIKLNDYILECKKRDFKYAAISEFENLYSYSEYNKLALENNIIPIFGLDLYFDNNLFTFFVKNEEGYLSLVKIHNLYKSIKNNSLNNLDQTNNLNISKLPSYKGLICVLNTNNPIFLSINEETIENYILPIKNLFEDFYIGLDIRTSSSINSNKLIEELVSLYGIKCIPFPLIKTLSKDGNITLKILNALSKDMTIEIDDLSNYSEDFSLLTGDDIANFYSSNSLKNLNDFVKNIQFNYVKKRANLIDYSKSNNQNISNDELLKQKILVGLKEHNIDIKNNNIYRQRLNYEYLTICKMGFSNYFLLVQDYVKFAKENNILVGPGRGSSGGSLVAYLLDITSCDPIKYNLLFERFLNPQRKTMPDIDVDFQDIKRDEVVLYLENKYGFDHVSRIVAFQTIKARNALRDSGRVLGFPSSIVDSISKTIPSDYKTKDGSIDFTLDYAYNNISLFKEKIDSTIDYQNIFKFAKQIEGLPRQTGLHAAGVLLNNESLFDIAPISFINDKEIFIEIDKDYLEDQGFLKFDILGLSNLTTISNCLTLINHNYNLNLKFEDIPIDDPKTFKLLQSENLMGLFQIDVSAGKRAILEIKPQNFKEIVDAISLARPGPIEFFPNYVKRRNNKEKITYPSKELIDILKPTYGIIIYQEQIMKIVQKYASFTFSEADTFRRAISKKHVDEIKEMKEKFINGSIKNKHSFKEANEIFNMILKFASYGFNQSHAVLYAMITSKMAYLKAYYPTEFYAAILSGRIIDSKFNNYLSEIKRMNITIELPNINICDMYFRPIKNSLVFPLNRITKISNELAKCIIDEREANGPYISYKDFVHRAALFNKKISEEQLTNLIDAGCFDTFINNRQALKKSAYKYDAQYIASEGAGKYIIDLKEEIDSSESESIVERLKYEKIALGIALSDSILKYLNLTKDEKNRIVPISSLKENKKSLIVGIINSVKTITIKNGNSKGKIMAFVSLEDENNEIDVTVFPSTYDKYVSELIIDNIVLIEGKKEIRDGKTSFVLDYLKKVSVYE